MPPKSGKKKLSKAEKERLKKEEAERKLREEEETRIQAERDEEERKVRDKEEAEERRRLENEERKKRKGQLQELDDVWNSHYNTLMLEQAEMKQRDKWARYMRCDGSPDPSVAGEINTYLNLWREDTTNLGVDSVLEDSCLCLSLLDELRGISENISAEEFLDKLNMQYKQTLTDLQILLREKLDLASHDLFLRATEIVIKMSDTKTVQPLDNLVVKYERGDITLCAWANLIKNPRIKSHTFEELGFTFEIPKVLSLTDCGVRLLFTKYDHFSEHSISYEPRFKESTQVEPEEGATAVEEVAGNDPLEPETEEVSVPEQTEDVMAALNALDDEPEDLVKVEEEPKPEVEQMEEDIEIKTPEPVEFDDFDGDEDAIDLRAYQVLGGVFSFDLIELPPQPRTMKNWIIRQVILPPSLKPIDYIADSVQSQTTEARKTEDGNHVKKDTEKPLIGVTIRLPEHVYYSEEPQIVCWDSEQRVWSLKGFTDHKFEEEKRMLSFKTTHFGTLALVQDIHINMPFQSWELRPRATNLAQLTIIAAIVEVEIQIKDDLCSLSSPDDKPELNHLVNHWYPVKTFIQRMKDAGLNLFPNCDSTKYVSIQEKNVITENRMYQQMAMVASAMAFSWSKWNAEVPEPAKEKIVVQVAEHLADDALMEEDWSIWMVTKKRTTKLKMTEFDETFSDDHAEGTEFNADMYHMTMELATDDAKDRIHSTNHKFVNSIYTILNSTKILTYS